MDYSIFQKIIDKVKSYMGTNAPRYAARRELCWYARIGRTNSTYKHLCKRPPDVACIFEMLLVLASVTTFY